MIDTTLYGYAVGLGVDLLRSGRVKDALRYFGRPVNYWRGTEYRFVWDSAGFQRDTDVLDIGSPKLLSLYLAERVGARVIATDIDSYFINNHLFLRDRRHIPSDRLEVGVEDGRRLSYPDQSFDIVYAISVVEHIPGDGDQDCLREMARVLRPGGRALITVPFAKQARDEYLNDFYWKSASVKTADERVFYQRRYDEHTIWHRLVEPSGLIPHKIVYIGERPVMPEGREVSENLPIITGPFQLAMAYALHVGPVSDWTKLKRPLCAMIALEKPA